MKSRRDFFRGLGLALLSPAVRMLAQTKKNMVVRSVRPENLEMPLEGFGEWITPVERFFVRSHHLVPQVELGNWTLRVDGEVGQPLSLTMQDLRQLPRAEMVGVLECAGNGRSLHQPRVPGAQWEHGAVGNARWAGVRLADVLRKAGLKSSAREVLFDGADVPPGTMPKFQRGIPLEKALDENTLLAYEMNGRPLLPAHGFPLRAVVPGWAGDSWAKWVTRVQVLDREFDGFFMATAYRRPARPVAPGSAVEAKEMTPVNALRVKSVIAAPRDGAVVAVAPVRIRGAAWTGEFQVAGVEVSTDSGRTWRRATLGTDQAPFGWRLWGFEWTPAREGYHVVLARAHDSSGDVQPLVADWNPGGYLWNAAPRVGVTVSNGPADAAAARHDATRQAPAPPPSVRAACMICHEADVIEQQRLTRSQWERELDKMIRWGAPVRPAGREDILRYLTQFGPQ